jgi:hypothetical protein
MTSLRTISRAPLLALAVIALATWAVAERGAAAPLPQSLGAICFPETGYCTGGRVREAWERGGGLMAFGYPITSLQEELLEGRPRMVQWFERARFELHPELPAPYDLLVGRVGAELMAAHPGRFARTSVPGECRHFPETGQSVCGEFLSAWLYGGLALDGDPAISDAESLALYGLPLSEPRTERLAGGGSYVVQWFERARFELHPENEGPYRVLKGRLGHELAPVAADPPGTPWAEQAPPAPPIAAVSLAGAPDRLVIGAIGLDVATVPAGIDGAGEFVVPNHEAGWYINSAAPGQGENIVLWGHVLPFLAAPDRPAPFARLKELAPGALVTLYDGAGRAHEYVVVEQIYAVPEDVAYTFRQGRELLTMVSCIGEGVYAAGGIVDYSQRLITIAVPR